MARGAVAVIVVGACGPRVEAAGDTDVGSSTSGPVTATTTDVGSTAVVDESTTSSGDESTTQPGVEPTPDPPPLIWFRQYSLFSPGGIHALDVSPANAVTIAGGVFDSFQSVVPNADEVDIVSEGSFVLRYEDDALAWSVHDGGRWNYLLKVLDDDAVVTVGSYDDDLQGLFAAGSPQEVALPPTFGEGMYVARYTNTGAFEWVLAASDGNPGALRAAVDPTGELRLLGLTNGGTSFQPDDSTVDAGYFRATYSLDGLGVSLQPGPFAYDAPQGIGTHELFVTGPVLWPDGSAAFVGTFCGTLVVAPGEANETPIVSEPEQCAALETPSTPDGLIARYRPNGTLDWLLTLLTPGGAWLYDAHVTSAGRLVVAGTISDDLELSDTHGTATAVEGPTTFVATFEADGALAWLRRIETTYTPPVIAAGVEGDVIAVGLLLESFAFEPGTEQEETLTGPGIYSIRWDATGEPRWAAMLVEGETYFSNLLVDVGEGTFAVAGAFGHTAVLLPGDADERTLEAETADLFVALFELE